MVTAFLDTPAAAGDLFIAIHQDGLDQRVADLQALSPDVMAWAEDTWVLNMGVTWAYWQAAARRGGGDARDAVRQALEGVAAGRPFRAALATHPWQALLLLGAMAQRGLHGVSEKDGRMGEALYRSVTWDTWERRAEECAPHFLAAQRLGFRPERLRQSLVALRRTMDRLGFGGPFAVSYLAPSAIKRRFGGVVHDLWQATVQDVACPGTGPFAGLIPWRPHAWPETPRVTRTLDFPLWEWDHVSVLLQQDLNRLCALGAFPPSDRVISLEWRIVLHDMASLSIPLEFRHPHPLHSETPHHKTALLQAYYGFTAVSAAWQRECLDPATGEALGPHHKPMVAWELSVSRRFRPTPTMRSLFDDDAADARELLRLENSLPIPLQAYALNRDWVAEDAFAPAPGGDGAAIPDLAEAEPALRQVHRCRPLFLYEHPPNLADVRQGSSAMWQFTERTMRKWWLQGTDAPVGERDYYRVIDREKRALWVYQEKPGEWYVHGIFA